jgi:uncharacterized protein
MAETPSPVSFHIMAKPTGPICNLDCKYCFYLEKDRLYPNAADWRMSDAVLEAYLRQTIQHQDGPIITFAWQGGEPTLLGTEFFRKAVALQRKFADGKRIENTFQTNGVLLDDSWGAFLAQNRFLVGLSIDGPQHLHDHYRVNRGGAPSFGAVMRGMGILKKHGVEFNTVSVVNGMNSHRPLEVYRFLRGQGSGFMQFIPIVERELSAGEAGHLRLIAPEDARDARVTEWSVEPLQYGEFLCAIFDEWVRRDVGRTFVQIFDVALEIWCGLPSSLCVFAETCGTAMALEHNGDLYSCDHYVYPENKLGNILEMSVLDLVRSEQQNQFGLDKRNRLPRECRECPVLFACRAECPKHRFTHTRDGEPGLNYLCPSYKLFFRHIDPFMRFMASELRNERPPANVMQWVRQMDVETNPPGRNDGCPCGSGRKYKKCCGRR